MNSPFSFVQNSSSNACIALNTLVSTYFEELEQSFIWLGRRIHDLARFSFMSAMAIMSRAIHNLCIERFFGCQQASPTTHQQVNVEEFSSEQQFPIASSLQISTEKLPFKSDIEKFINNPPKQFREIISDIKNASTNKLLSGQMDSLVEQHLERAKDNRMALHLMAYALFSGERKFPLAPLSATCLLFVLNDPLSSNEDVLKLIKLTFQDRKNEFSIYGCHSSNEQSKAPVIEKGLFKNSDENVSINHGGGLFHIWSFLNNLSEGYAAPGEYEGRGLFVYVGEGNRTSFYANRMEMNFDLPASLNAILPANLLGTANVQNECVLRSNCIGKLQNLSIAPVLRRFEQIVPSNELINSLPCEPALHGRIRDSIQRLRKMGILGPYQ